MTTLQVLAVTVAFLIIYDVYIAATKGGDATISWQSYLVARSHPIIAVAVGVVVGHIFWVQNTGCLP